MKNRSGIGSTAIEMVMPKPRNEYCRLAPASKAIPPPPPKIEFPGMFKAAPSVTCRFVATKSKVR